MFVGRVRPRPAQRRWSTAVRSVAATIGVVLLAAGCAAVEDAIDSSGSEDAVEETSTTVPAFDPDTYCALSHEADQLNASFDQFSDPIALEGFIGDLVGLLNEGAPPPEIDAEFATLRRAYVDLQSQLAASGFDPAVLASSPILSDANVNAAMDAVDAHDLALCGPAPGVPEPDTEGDDTAGDDTTADDTAGVDPATDPFAAAIASGDFTAVEEILGTEIGRQAFIEGFTETSPGVTVEQASCFLDNTDIAVLAEMAMDPSDLSDEAVSGFLAALDACNIPLSAFQTE